MSFRLYIQTKLLLPMEAGRSYDIEFDLKKGVSAIPALEFIISDSTYYSDQNVFHSGTPSLSLNKKQLQDLNQNLRWHHYQMQYTATGGEEFIIIGMFNQDRPEILEVEIVYGKLPTVMFDNFEIRPSDGTQEGNLEIVRNDLYKDDLRHPQSRYFEATPDSIAKAYRHLVNSVYRDRAPIRSYVPPIKWTSMTSFELDDMTFNTNVFVQVNLV